jgi:Rieske Fe-S protein
MKKILKNILFSATSSLLLLTACNKTNSTDSSSAIPYAAVNLTLNVNSSAYTSLTPVGGVAYLTSVGYRGIMLYHINAGTILAFDRTCSYDISDVNGIVYAQNNGTAICPDCNSTYLLANGNVNTGPSTIGLTEYHTTYVQSTGVLTITN